MKEIQLTRGLVALIDDEDYELVSQYNWHARRGNNTFYATVKNSIHIHMHRLILGLDKNDLEVDHIDGNGLNNQRSNLRKATSTQNKVNRPKVHIGSSSQYKGVCWDKNRNKWQANITVDYKLKYLGRFNSEEEAARAYDKAASELHGEYSILNFKEAV